MITDERLDELFRTWAREQVAEATQTTAVVDAEIVELALPATRRRFRLWEVAASVVVLLVVATVALVTTEGDSHQPAADAPVTALYGDWVAAPSPMDVSIGPRSVIVSVPNVSCSGLALFASHVTASRLFVGRRLVAPSGDIPCAGMGDLSPYEVLRGQLLRQVVFSDPTWRVAGRHLTLTAPNGASTTLTRR